MRATTCFFRIISPLFLLLSVLTVQGQHQRVLLENVQVLTFHSGQRTTGRRSAPVPQMSCVGGDCSAPQPQVVQCRNVGLDDTGQVQWQCEGRLPSNYEFGATDVSCEGYDSRTDRYILAGSCGLEYTLQRTGHSGWGSGGTYSQSYYGTNSRSSGSWLGTLVSWFFFGVFVLLIVQIVSTLCSGGERRHPRPSNYNSAAYNFDDFGNQPRNRSGTGDFWSGFGLGGLFGYGLGDSGRGYYGSDYYDNGWGWRSGWGWGNRGYRRAYNSGYAEGNAMGFVRGSNAVHSSASSSSSSREHTSRGYGTSRRR